MTSEVLYRKWRPPRFSDVVGQGVTTQILAQAVASGRIAHAYLLAGPRGTGKTSTARIIAKALNCRVRPEGVGDPCGACEHCSAIERGNFIDLIELDGASSGGIDSIRDIVEKARYAPNVGKTKVYIIDEAHQLSAAASNAFLKTLEEPPPSTIFVLATTEPDKILPTILSRCQRYDFRRISPKDVVERLEAIALAEQVHISAEILRMICQVSGGSLRDATNLLDQIITSFGAQVSVEQVQELLGLGGEDRALALVKHLLGGGTAAALELINTSFNEGLDLRPMHHMAVNFLRSALLFKSGVKEGIQLSADSQSQLSFAASNTTLEHITRALHLFGEVGSGVSDHSSPLPMELATVELGMETTRIPEVAPGASISEEPAPQISPTSSDAPSMGSHAPTSTLPTIHQSEPEPAEVDSQASATPIPQPAPPRPVTASEAPAGQIPAAEWRDLTNVLRGVPKRRIDVQAMFRSADRRRVLEGILLVAFSSTANAERLQDELDEPQCRMEVERRFTEALGQPIAVRVEKEDRVSAASGPNGSSGHLVQAAVNMGAVNVGYEVVGGPDGTSQLSGSNQAADEVITGNGDHE